MVSAANLVENGEFSYFKNHVQFAERSSSTKRKLNNDHKQHNGIRREDSSILVPIDRYLVNRLDCLSCAFTAKVDLDDKDGVLSD